MDLFFNMFFFFITSTTFLHRVSDGSLLSAKLRYRRPAMLECRFWTRQYNIVRRIQHSNTRLGCVSNQEREAGVKQPKTDAFSCGWLPESHYMQAQLSSLWSRPSVFGLLLVGGLLWMPHIVYRPVGLNRNNKRVVKSDITSPDASLLTVHICCARNYGMTRIHI